MLSTEPDRENLLKELAKALCEKQAQLKDRERDTEKMMEIINELVRVRPYRLIELASILQKGENNISRRYLKPMTDAGQLKFLCPEMINHPDQRYVANN